MAYNFKSIADVEVVAEPTETANVLIEENGVIKKAPKTAVGGGGLDFIIIAHNDWTAELVAGDYNDLYNKLSKREFVNGKVITYFDTYGSFDGCSLISDFNFELATWDDTPCIHIIDRYRSYDYYTLMSNNEVVFWSVD